MAQRQFDPVAATFTILSSGLVVSGNTQIIVMEQITSGDAFSSIKVSGFTESIQIYRGKPSSEIPVTGHQYFGAFSENVSVDIYVRGASYDSSGGNNQAFQRCTQRVQDTITTTQSGVWWSGFNLPMPKLVSVQWPMPSELNTVAKLVFRHKYLL